MTSCERLADWLRTRCGLTWPVPALSGGGGPWRSSSRWGLGPASAPSVVERPRGRHEPGGRMTEGERRPPPGLRCRGEVTGVFPFGLTSDRCAPRGVVLAQELGLAAASLADDAVRVGVPVPAVLGVRASPVRAVAVGLGLPAASEARVGPCGGLGRRRRQRGSLLRSRPVCLRLDRCLLGQPALGVGARRLLGEKAFGLGPRCGLSGRLLLRGDPGRLGLGGTPGSLLCRSRGGAEGCLGAGQPRRVPCACTRACCTPRSDRPRGSLRCRPRRPCGAEPASSPRAPRWPGRPTHGGARPPPSPAAWGSAR
jgi:hypothetical protein